jgi:hypothetical protein
MKGKPRFHAGIKLGVRCTIPRLDTIAPGQGGRDWL